MRINIKNFKNVLTKGTMNFGIETLQLRFKDGKIKSNMLSRTGTSIAILNVENNVIDVENEELVWNFFEPATDVIPFINLIDSETVEMSLTDLFIKIKDGETTTKIGFASENAVRRLGTDDVQNDEWFFEMPIDIDFIKLFEKIKKIGSRFGKVYFVVKDKTLYIETSDKTNMYSNGYTVKLAEQLDMPDISLAYVYTDMVNFFHCIEMDLDKNFILKIEYKDEQGLGCIYASSEKGEEKYSLISRDSL
jgi:hypothetical protein